MTQASQTSDTRPRNRRATVAGLAAVVALLAVGATAVMTRQKGDSPAGSSSALPAVAPTPAGTPLAAEQGPDLMIPQRTKGDPAAPITIYEIADFQCPACRMFWEQTLPAIERDYVRTGKARIVFINFPITSIHRNAAPAAALAMCAARQDRFWPMHDLLFATQTDWAALADPAPYFRTLADSAGMSQQSLGDCMATGETQAMVQAETEASWQAGVKSTPSFIVQGALLAGAAPIDIWRPILDSIFTATTTAR